MNTKLNIAAAAAVLAAGLWAAPQLQASPNTPAGGGAMMQPGQTAPGQMMGHQMMGNQMMGHQMMGHQTQPGMMGEMNMMGEMSKMMKTCNSMMQSMIQDHRDKPGEPGAGNGHEG